MAINAKKFDCLVSFVHWHFIDTKRTDKIVNSFNVTAGTCCFVCPKDIQ